MNSGFVSPRAPMMLADGDVEEEKKEEVNIAMWIVIGVVW